MTEHLSHLFFGNKLLLKPHYHHLITSLDTDLLRSLFSEWLSNMSEGNPQLQQLQLDFLVLNVKAATKMNLSFPKFSSFMELSAAVFEDSFRNHLSRKESFELFKEVVVRHSLFRPPYSVKVFETEEVKELSRFWLETFDRYFEEYECCFGTDLDEQVVTLALPVEQMEKPLGKEKVRDVAIMQDLLSRLQLK